MRPTATAFLAVATVVLAAVGSARGAMQITNAYWGRSGGNYCPTPTSTTEVHSDVSETAYQWDASIVDRAAALCEAAGPAGCAFAYWAKDDVYPTYVVTVCSEMAWDANEPYASGLGKHEGLLTACWDDEAVPAAERVVCRPPIASDARQLGLRVPTRTVPWRTQCVLTEPLGSAPTCACAAPVVGANGAVVARDPRTCDALSCVAGCGTDAASHGVCDALRSVCVCEDGWVGATCASRCPVSTISRLTGRACGGHGSCVASADGGSGECVCDAGWGGTACDVCDSPAYAPHLNCSLTCRTPAHYRLPEDATRGWDGDAASEVCGGPHRGACDPYRGCVCSRGSNLDPRLACGACLPGMFMDPAPHLTRCHRSLPVETPIVQALGTELTSAVVEPVAACRISPVHYTQSLAEWDGGASVEFGYACKPAPGAEDCGGPTRGECYLPGSGVGGNAGADSASQTRVPTATSVCVCYPGYTGQWCERERVCSGVLGGYGCSDGVRAVATTLATNPQTTFGALASRQRGVPALARAPGPTDIELATRLFVLRQREVELAGAGGGAGATVVGVTTAHSRLYTVVRAEYLCYRAGRARGGLPWRLVTEADIGSIPDAELVAVADDARTRRSDEAPLSDYSWWIRSTAGGEVTNAWTYRAVAVSTSTGMAALSTARTYTGAPSEVGRVVCAADGVGKGDPVAASAAFTLDVEYRCRIPAWFCALWASAAGRPTSECVR